MSDRPTIVIILAAQRAGVVNPLAERAGVSHKCLAPIYGKPLIEWVLDTCYRHCFHRDPSIERSLIVFGAMEAALTPLKEDLVRSFAGVRVFSQPSDDHPEFGRHIELGDKGAMSAVDPAFEALRAGLQAFDLRLGPEMVRK